MAIEPPPKQARQASWSRYWSSGALHSCAGSFAGNYDGEVRSFWQAAVTALPAPTRALDVATGNGPVAKLLLELTATTTRLSVDAVDLAQVQPDWPRALPAADRERLRFHSGVAAEALPFADASFDLVASQFGIEYSDLPRALAEVRRVLRPGGCVALIVHAEESLIVRRAVEELPHSAWLQAQTGLWSLAERLCGPMARASTPAGRQSLAGDVAAARDRQEFNEAMAAISARAADADGTDLLRDVQRSIAGAFAAATASGEAEAGRRPLRDLRQALADGELRLRELVESARSRDEVAGIAVTLGAGIETLAPVHFGNGEMLGWGLRLRA